MNKVEKFYRIRNKVNGMFKTQGNGYWGEDRELTLDEQWAGQWDEAGKAKGNLTKWINYIHSQYGPFWDKPGTVLKSNYEIVEFERTVSEVELGVI